MDTWAETGGSPGVIHHAHSFRASQHTKIKCENNYCTKNYVVWDISIFSFGNQIHWLAPISTFSPMAWPPLGWCTHVMCQKLTLPNLLKGPKRLLGVGHPRGTCARSCFHFWVLKKPKRAFELFDRPGGSINSCKIHTRALHTIHLNLFLFIAYKFI